MERQGAVINWAIIGAGGISTRFAGVLAREKGMAVRAVYNRHGEKARALAANHAGCESFDSLDALLKGPDIEAAYIGLTNDMHLPAAIRLMEAGKAVLCEKPMAMTAKDAEEMIACAKANGVLLMEAMWTRFLPVYRRIREWIGAGAIGAARQIEASFCFNSAFEPESRVYRREKGGGALYDVGVYGVEFITGLLGRPDSVSGAVHYGPSGVDDLTVVNLLYDHGAIGTASSAIVVDAPARAVIYGDKGFIRIPGDFYRAQKAQRYDDRGELAEEIEERFDDGFIYQIRHFGQLLLSGRKESDVMPLMDTLDCAAVFDTVLARKAWTKRS